MSYVRRVPREPEAQHSWEAADAAPSRPRLDPPTLMGETTGPKILLSDRQLELLAQRQKQQQGTQHDNRSRTYYGGRNTQSQQQQQKRRGRDPSVIEYSQHQHHRQQQQQQSSPWMQRTPNPTSRSELSGSIRNPSSPTYLNQILRKAMSSSSSHSGRAGSGNSNNSSIGAPRHLENHGKRSLKKVLAKRVLRNKNKTHSGVSSMDGHAAVAPTSKESPTPPTSTSTTLLDHSRRFSTSNNTGTTSPPGGGYTLRERLRQVKKDATPKKDDPSQQQQQLVVGQPPFVDSGPPPPPPPPPPSSGGVSTVVHNNFKKTNPRIDDSNYNKKRESKNASTERDNVAAPDGYAELFEVIQTEVFGSNSQVSRRSLCFQLRKELRRFCAL